MDILATGSQMMHFVLYRRENIYIIIIIWQNNLLSIISPKKKPCSTQRYTWRPYDTGGILFVYLTVYVCSFVRAHKHQIIFDPIKYWRRLINLILLFAMFVNIHTCNVDLKFTSASTEPENQYSPFYIPRLPCYCILYLYTTTHRHTKSPILHKVMKQHPSITHREPSVDILGISLLAGYWFHAFAKNRHWTRAIAHACVWCVCFRLLTWSWLNLCRYSMHCWRMASRFFDRVKM